MTHDNLHLKIVLPSLLVPAESQTVEGKLDEVDFLYEVGKSRSISNRNEIIIWATFRDKRFLI